MRTATAHPPDEPSSTLTRRSIVRGACAVVAGLAVAPLEGHADEPVTPQFEAAYKKLTGESEVRDGSVKLVAPEVAENGNMVPFTVSVDSPMTADDHVTAVTILSTANPQPIIARFQFSPESGRVLVSGRLRLARTQDLIAVAELKSGAMIKTTAKVAVNIGGCSG